MIQGESFGLFTACYGERYAKYLPEWERSVRGLDPAPDEVFIVGDEFARDRWTNLGRFVLAPEFGVPSYRQAASYNHVLREMRADWIMHVGVDDLVFRTLISDMARHFGSADVVACDVSVERNGLRFRIRRNRPTAGALLRPTLGGQALDACACYRRKFWELAPYNEEIIGGSDVALWIGFARRGARFAWTGVPGVRYRLHSDSLWHQRSPENIRAVRMGLNALRSDSVEIAFEGARYSFGFDTPDDYLARVLTKLGTFYELELLQDIRRRFAGARGVALDVGAHVGNHSVFLAKVCGLHVVAIEPHRPSRRLLSENATRNGVEKRIRIVETVAGSRPGRCSLQRAEPGNSGSITATYGRGVVPVATIDSLRLNNVRVMKIDVEGNELDVIRGARETISQNRPVIYAEAKTPAHRAAIAEALAGFGYDEAARFGPTPTYSYTPRDPPAIPRADLSIAVMAHPRRKLFVRDLLARLDVKATVVWDERNDRWDTGRRSLLAYDPAVSHHLVIQDDALPCSDLRASLLRALEVVPDAPISLYLGRQRPHAETFADAIRRAEQSRARWIVGRELCWGVALCFPTRIIRPMVEFCDEKPHVRNYDRRLSVWLETNGIRTFYTVPSLVDHRPEKENPSLVPGRRGASRIAHRFIGLGQSALGIDWETAPVEVSGR